MPEIFSNYPLKALNSFGIEAKAQCLIRIQSTEDLQELILNNTFSNPLILGGGSNILFTSDYQGFILKNEVFGKTITEENEQVMVEVGGGENWHELVLWAINRGFGGIENLSLIPGTVGAAPIQNIGAYGVELVDVFAGLEAVRLEDGHVQWFDQSSCQFGYRNSYFKQSGKGKYFITKVKLKLTKPGFHKINTSYGAIAQKLMEMKVESPGIKAISEAVIAIRQSKLPDPAELGNAGSFFKNPIIPIEQFERLHQNEPNVPHYKVDEANVKIPAGWLIEQCGFKGKRYGAVGTYHKQALVLVNHGKAKGKDVLSLANEIQRQVLDKYGISLEFEVNIV